jgi:lipoprotein-releasing system ATP-binding protein
MSEPVLALQSVSKTFVQGGARLEILRGVSMVLEPGQAVALLGPSGSGKSTLLHIAALLERPSAGEVIVQGRPSTALSEVARTRLRRDRFGMVYQYHHLLPEFSALENVIIPQMIAGAASSDARARAEELLARFGLSDRADHRPARLSGGEQQRVAIARAIANRPALLLADEPTGNLDLRTADEVFGELMALVRGDGLSAFVATHNVDLAGRMDRIVELQDGVLVERSSPTF